MVLYHAVSTYHILESFVHRHLFHNKEHAILLLPDFIINKFPYYEKITELGLFDEIFLLPYRELSHEINTLRYKIEDFYLNNVPYNINDFSEIYVFAAHFYFSHYLINNKIYFNFFEDGCGILCRPDISYELVNSNTPFQASWAQENGLFDGSNTFIKNIICNLQAQSKPITLNNVQNFDVAVELENLHIDIINKILQFFKVPSTINFNKNSLLVLTQQLANLKRVTYEQQIELYQLNLSYFSCDYNLIFKPHPDDVIDYSTFFPHSEVIREVFPAELLPHIAKKNLKAGFVLYSSSLLSIEHFLETKIFCGYGIEEQYFKLNRYYFSIVILKELLKDNLYSIVTIGIYKPQFNNLLKHCFNYRENKAYYTEVFSSNELSSSINCNTKKVYIIDDITEASLERQDIDYLCNNITYDDIIIFLNCKNEFVFYNCISDIFKDITPIIIKKIFKTDVKKALNNENIYVYTKNHITREKLIHMSAKKDLKYAEYNLQVEALTPEALQIALLEGQLKATEERLSFYIQKEKKEHQK